MTDTVDDEFEGELDEELRAETDRGSDRVYASLDQAFEAHRIPFENRDVIRRAVAHVGISGYSGTARYIKAHRKDGGPDLHITYGYTNGFVSREEAEAVGVSAWQSGRMKDTWGFTHPVHNKGSGNKGPKRERRDYGTCPDCNTKYTASGACMCL